MRTGIYTITNKSTGKVYVGSSICVDTRYKAHKYLLDRNKHHSRKLQHSWNKHGSDAFDFAVVLICEQRDLLMYEQQVIDFHDAYRKGYNGIPNAKSRAGSKQHKDVIERMTQFQRSYRKKYEWKGQMLCLAEIAEMEGMNRDLLFARIYNGWDLERAAKTPRNRCDSKFSAYGKTRTFQEWADVLHVPVSNLRLWERNCKSFEDAIENAKRITVHELARWMGMPSTRVGQRIRLGWSLGDALSKPADGTHVMKRTRKTA